MTDHEQPTTPPAPGDTEPAAVPYALDPPGQPNGQGPPPATPPPGFPPPPVRAPGTPHAPARPPRRTGLGWRWVWMVLGILVLAAGIASRINLNYYAITPGTAQPVQPFITVPPGKSHPVTHSVLLTDVGEARVSALTYLFFKWQSDTSLYSVPDVTGGTAPSELEAQGTLQMSQAEQAAKTAALRHLGYPVPGTPAGAVITGTFPGTPAYGVLNVGDVVVAVDGTPTLTAKALTTALATHHSGETVTFSMRKNGTGTPVPVPLTLKRTKVQVGTQTAYLDVGIEPQDQVDFHYPFPVSINVTNIGGPSAGLAMTLGVIDALSSGSLTGGRTVAATGTMDASGDVGDVGGVAQKTVAVENAGASIFLVPPGEYKDAKSKDRPGLKVYAVSTLDQALRVLAANGGQAAHTTLDAAPSASAG